MDDMPRLPRSGLRIDRLLSVALKGSLIFFIWNQSRTLLLAFCTGTAAEVCPIAKLATGTGEEPFEVTFPHGQSLPGGPVTGKLLTMLREVMVGERSSEGTAGWLRDPFSSPEEFCKE